MRRLLAPVVAGLVFSGLIGCPADTRLDDAIARYVEARQARAAAACECYQLFLDPNHLPNSPTNLFTSHEDCIETLPPPPEDQVAECMKSFFASVGYDTEKSVDVVLCYTETITEQSDCFAQNAECSYDACFSDVAKTDLCQGQLTEAEAEQLNWCGVRDR